MVEGVSTRMRTMKRMMAMTVSRRPYWRRLYSSTEGARKQHPHHHKHCSLRKRLPMPMSRATFGGQSWLHMSRLRSCQTHPAVICPSKGLTFPTTARQGLLKCWRHSLATISPTHQRQRRRPWRWQRRQCPNRDHKQETGAAASIPLPRSRLWRGESA